MKFSVGKDLAILIYDLQRFLPNRGYSKAFYELILLFLGTIFSNLKFHLLNFDQSKCSSFAGKCIKTLKKLQTNETEFNRSMVSLGTYLLLRFRAQTFRFFMVNAFIFLPTIRFTNRYYRAKI